MSQTLSATATLKKFKEDCYSVLWTLVIYKFCSNCHLLCYKKIRQKFYLLFYFTEHNILSSDFLIQLTFCLSAHLF